MAPAAGERGVDPDPGQGALRRHIHSNYAVTYRSENPGTFWALWVVLLLPLIAVLFLVFNLHPGGRP